MALAPLLASGSAGSRLTPYGFGAAGDGVRDDTAALQRAVSAAIERDAVLDLERGTYRVTASITGTGHVRIVNSGGAVIMADRGNYKEFGVLVFAGRASPAGRLSASATRGGRALTATAASAFAPGDIGAIYDPTDSSYSGFRRYYRAGEFFEVAGSTGRTVSLRNPLYEGYERRAVELSRIEPVTGYIRDVVIRSNGSPDSLIVIDYGYGFEVSRPRLRHANNSCIVFNRSMRCRIDDPAIENKGDGGDDYGIVWANSQHGRVSGGEIYARRHAVAMGGSDNVNGVPCRDVVIEKAMLRNDSSTGVHCADIHGNSEKCGYDDCVIFGGFSPQGRDSFLRNSTVHAMSIGTAVYAAELLGGNHVIEGNTFHFATDPSRRTRGALDFGGNSDAITSNTTEALTIVVRDNIFISTVFSKITMLLAARNAGSAEKINIRFVDNDLRVNDYAAAIMIRRHKGVARSDFLEVARNASSLRGRRSFYPDGEYSALPALRI